VSEAKACSPYHSPFFRYPLFFFLFCRQATSIRSRNSQNPVRSIRRNRFCLGRFDVSFCFLLWFAAASLPKKLRKAFHRTAVDSTKHMFATFFHDNQSSV
jgi:hypothetical protein